MVDPLIIGLVAVSAVLHVAWNIRLKTAGDPLRAATVGMLAASVGIVPVGAVAWWATGAADLPVAGVALGIVSGMVEAGYFQQADKYLKNLTKKASAKPLITRLLKNTNLNDLTKNLELL